MLAAPQLLVAFDQAIQLRAGTALHIPLNAIDPEGDAITFSASVDNAAFEAVTPQGNRSVIFRLSHESSGQQGDVTFTDEIMTVELLEDIAPETAGRFAGLVDADAYDGLTFHRLVSNFAAQFGDPDGVGTGGSGVTIDDEFSKYSRHTTPFLLSTAKSLDDTFDMQAFLTQGGANSTRNLDFNHTVFGVVTSFSSEISFNIPVTQNPVTGENTFPVSPITISDASVYVDDQNGVLRLYVPDDVPVGTTATVTLTLTDANGETSTETLTVEVAADPFNDQPFFDPDPEPVITDFNVPVSFTLQATDIENDPIEFLEGTAGEYSQRGLTQNPNVQVSVDPNTGEVTVTPNEMIAGTIAVLVKVRQVSGNNGASDFQVVPVSIRPPAIDGVVLLSDSGVLDDNITAVNNSNQLPLQFRADGVFAGVPVQLLIDGEVVQEITPTEEGSVVFTLDGDTPVADGTHDVVARLVAYNVLQFGNFDQFAVPGLEHEPLSITIDTRPIVFESSPVTQATLLAPYTYDVATDRDGEAGLEYSLLESPDGMTIDPSTGVIQWTPTADQGGETTVSVQAVDVAGNANSQTFNVYVNTPPVLLEVGNKTVDEGMLLEVQLMVDDPDAGETFTYQLFGVVPPGAAIDSSGKFTFTPTEAQGPNTFNINVRVTDSRGGTDQTTFAVQVNEVPQPPVISPVADQLVLPGGSLSFNVVATDPDIPQQGLGFSLDPGAPDGAAIDAVTGLFTYDVPGDQPFGEFSVTVRVTEVAGEELSSTVTFKINIVENLPPVFPDQQTDFSTNASEPLSFDVVAVDPGPGSEELVYSLEPGTPDFVTIDPATGRVTVTTTRQTPPQTVEIVVRVTEATDQDATATKTFSVEITDPPNLPPVFPDQPMSFTTQASVPLTFGVTAIDPDEVPVPLIYSLEPGTPNFVTIDPSTGQVTVTTTRQTPPQTLDIIVRVTEDRSDALSATKVFTVEITTAPNLPPAFPAQPTEFTTEVGDLLSFDAVAVDPEQVALIYSLEPGAPQIVSINSATGKVTVNSSTSTLPQTIKFVVRATEPGAGGLSATQEYTVNLVPISNQSPVINPTVRQAVRQGLQVKFNIDAYDPDSPATPLVYSLGPDAPPEATINPLTGEVTFAATPNTTVGVYRFGVQVAENAADGLTTGSTIEVQVNPLGIRELIGIGNTRFGPDPSSLVPSTTNALSSASLAGFFSSTTSTSSSPGRSPLTPITPDNFPGSPFNNITYGVNTGVGQSYTKDGEEAEQEEGENLDGDQLPNEENSQENTEGVVPTQAIEPVEDSDGDKKAEGDAAVEGEEKAPKAAMWDDRLIDWATTEHWPPGDESFARTMNASVNRMRNSGHTNDPYDIDLEPLVAPHMTVGAKQQATQAPQFGPSRGSSSTLVVPAPGSEEATSTAQEPPVEVKNTVSDEMATVAAASMAIYMPMLVTDLPEAKQSRRRWRKWLGEG